MNPIFQKAIPLLEKVERAGFEAYFVGGCVRDLILGKEMADVDIATSATPFELKEIFPKTIDVGIEHGTIMIIWDKDTYELTTFRTDGEYKDFRRPSEVMFIRTLIDDLKRRDFTMNSMAMDKKGKLIDPFNGQKSIEERVIQTVGSPQERFHEDALRMMRAVRFVSQLSFTIEQNTFSALKENASILGKIATERKTVEFEKLLKGENKKHAFHLLLESGLYAYLPGLKGQHQELLKMLDYELNNLSVVELWALLLYCLQKPEKDQELFLKEWKLPVKKIKQIKSVIRWLSYRNQSKWTMESLYEAKLDNVLQVERVYNTLKHLPILHSIEPLKKMYQSLVIKDKQELDISGTDLMNWKDLEAGPWIKETLATIEMAVVNGKLENNRDKIREWLLKCNQS